MRFGGRTAVIVVLASVAWVAASLLWLFPADRPDVVIQPVERYDSDDLRRAADALEALRETRLTPDERDAVDDTARILHDLSTGDAVIAPATTVPPAPPPTTTTTTTTTQPPPPTTVPDEPGTILDVPLVDHLDDYVPPTTVLP